MTWLVRNRLLFFFIILFLLSGSTYFLIQIARGYRFDLKLGELKAHGLLALKSNPDGAKIYLNGELRGATNTTLTLTPGKYHVEVEKSGFNHWSKLLTIQKELVTQADLFLFPQIPNLQPITYDGITKPIVSPDKTALAFVTVSTTNGISLYLYNLSSGLLDFNRSPRLIFDNGQDLLGNADYNLDWSPDSKWLVLKPSGGQKYYLINPNQLNTVNDIMARSTDYLKTAQQWLNYTALQKQTAYKRLPPELTKLIDTNTTQVTFSPDGFKLFYLATGSATLATNLITLPPIVSTQTENRAISPGRYYVYDIKEDKNFLLPLPAVQPAPTSSTKKQTKPVAPTKTPLQWLPSSNHLIWVDTNKDKPEIWVCEADGTNQTLVFAGVFDPTAVFTETGMGKLLIVSNWGNESVNTYNLYSLNLSH